MAQGAHIVSISNQKGGVGKTTTAINLAAFLAEEGKRTLLVDLDPQSNASSGIGINLKSISGSLYELLAGKASVEDVLCPTTFSNLHVLPASQDLAAIEVELAGAVSRETYLKSVLDPLREHYDFVIIDCPPSLGMLTLNGLVASDYVLIPVQCEYFALEGIGHLVHTLEEVRMHMNPDLQIAGILLTMFDQRTTLNREVVDSTRRFFKRLVFQSIVPRNIKLSEAPSHGIPILLYQPHSRGAEAYRELTQEVLDRVKGS